MSFLSSHVILSGCIFMGLICLTWHQRKQLKIIDNKIKANQAQYDLDRLAAKISAYSSGDLRKYEYLTGEDLGYKPSVFEQAKFDYSPLGNIFY